jgi:hypothetical protein
MKTPPKRSLDGAPEKVRVGQPPGGAHVVAGSLVISGGCLEPTPAEPLTCAVGATVGIEQYGVAGGLFYGAYWSFKNVTIPVWQQVFQP